MKNSLIILNIGGTFNKIYNPLTGELFIPKENTAIKEILKISLKTDTFPKIEGILYKDSLEMDKKDRKQLLQKIISLKEKKIIIIHGTDTMKKSAKIVSKYIQDKTVVFVGAMQPYSIEPIEASFGLGMALGFVMKTKKKGVFICMNGLLKKHNKIKKNYEKGVFECL